MQDPQYLRRVTYPNSSRLNARIAFWERYGNDADDRYSWYFVLLSPPANARILEVGCGPGGMWHWGMEHGRVPIDWNITLTDLSEGMLQDANQALLHLDRPFEFQVADVCQLPFDDSSIDVVIANHMLYHATDIGRAASEITRVLTPDGKLYAATNSEAHIREFVGLQERFAVTGQGTNSGPAHRAFTLENGSEILRSEFSIVTVHPDEGIAQADDVNLILAYVESMDAEVGLESVKSHVLNVIDDQGYFPVTRASGVLVASL